MFWTVQVMDTFPWNGLPSTNIKLAFFLPVDDSLELRCFFLCGYKLWGTEQSFHKLEYGGFQKMEDLLSTWLFWLALKLTCQQFATDAFVFVVSYYHCWL